MPPTSNDVADISARPRSHRARRLIAGLATTTALTAGGIAVLATPASANGGGRYSTTISEWASADWTLGDAKNTTLTVAGGYESSGEIGRRLTTKKSVSVSLNQSFCEVVGGGDVLVVRSLGAQDVPVTSGISVTSLFGKASVKAAVAVTGTETRTPAGTGGDCNELGAPGAPTPISDSLNVNVSYKNKQGSSPVYWSDPYQGAVFYSRDATGKGSISSASTGTKTLASSATGWLWAGAWAYPTDGSAPSPSMTPSLPNSNA